MPDIEANRRKVVAAVVRVIKRLQDQADDMPKSLRRLCIQIRTECLARMIGDNVSPD